MITQTETKTGIKLYISNRINKTKTILILRNKISLLLIKYNIKYNNKLNNVYLTDAR